MVVAGQADEKENTCDVLEAVYPLPPLAFLAADVDHQHLMRAELERGLGDPNGPCTRVNDILMGGCVCGFEETIQGGKEIGQAARDIRKGRWGLGERIYTLFWQGGFVSALVCLPYAWVVPQRPKGIQIRGWIGFAVLDVARVLDEVDMREVVLHKFELHVFHCVEDVFHAVGEVVEDEMSIGFDFLLGEGDLVDETHLLGGKGRPGVSMRMVGGAGHRARWSDWTHLEDGRLAGVTGAQEQNLADGGDQRTDGVGEVKTVRYLDLVCHLGFGLSRRVRWGREAATGCDRRATHFLQGQLSVLVHLLLLIGDVVVPRGRQAGAHWDGRRGGGGGRKGL